ncbi:MFS transporter [Herbaspirillum sp. GCM10030257]|uniref:MFS transporter n=1 Tax=Herbaspirillum sp. GCM10030257 TaxID=3273393 RepID=UPI00362001C5
MMVLAHTAFTGGRVALTLFAIELGGTPFEVGFVVSLMAVIPMLTSVHAGRWTDRTGVVKPTAIALLMLAAGTLLPGLLPSIASLSASAVFLGCGFMLVHLAINNAVGHGSTPQNRTRSFSMLALGFSTSTVAGPVAAGFLIDFAGHARTFLTLALLPILALIVLAKIYSKATLPNIAVTATVKPKVIDLLRHAPLRAVFIVSGLLSMGWDLFTFMTPMHGARIGLSASTIGLIMGTFGVGTFVVRLVMPRLSSSYSQWQILTGALALTTAVYFLFPLFNAVAILLTLSFILGLGLGSALPTIMSAIHETAPIGRSGEAVGVRSMLINASQSVLPVSFGMIGAAVGTNSVYWVLAIMLACGCMFAIRQERKKLEEGK